MAGFVMTLPHPLSLGRTIDSHGWVRLSPWTWDDENRVLERPEKMDGWRGRVRVGQKSPAKINVDTGPKSLPAPVKKKIRKLVDRWLSASWDPGPALAAAKTADKQVAGYIETGGGRFLRGSSFYEDFVKTVCTLNASWAFTRKMAAALVEKAGGGFFPLPGDILAMGEVGLKNKIRMGYRARVLINVTERMLADKMIDDHGRRTRKKMTYQYLVSLKGIGPYAASHAMALLHDFSRIPVDSEATAYLKENLGISPKQIPEYFAPWGEHVFLGYNMGRIIRETGWTGD